MYKKPQHPPRKYNYVLQQISPGSCTFPLQVISIQCHVMHLAMHTHVQVECPQEKEDAENVRDALAQIVVCVSTAKI